MTGAVTSPLARRFITGAAGTAVLAVLLLSGHAMAPRAAAIDECATSNCATISVTFWGTGTAHATDDQFQLDCTYNGSTQSGTCIGQYVWIKLLPTLDVTVTVTPGADTQACPESCGGIGEAVPTTLHLGNTSAPKLSVDLYQAKTHTLTISGSGDGSGRVTSGDGFNCLITAGVTSGTCSKTYVFTDEYSTLLTDTPASGSYACMNTFCSEVDQKLVGDSLHLFSTDVTQKVQFSKGHPIVTVAISGHGTVTTDPSLITCPGSCSSYVPEGFVITLTAKPKAGWAFDHWTGICSAEGAQCIISPASQTDIAMTAVFAALATPTPEPTATPRPTATPPPPATPRPSAMPRPVASAPGVDATAPATVAPATAPAAGQASADVSLDPALFESSTAGATGREGAPTGPVGALGGSTQSSGGPDMPSNAASDPASLEPDSGPFLAVVSLALAALVALAVVVAALRRGRRANS